MSVLNIFRESIQTDIENRENKKKERHYPSELFRCPRELFYTWKNETPTDLHSVASEGRMRLGNVVEDYFFNALEKLTRVEREIAIRTKLPGLKHEISMRLDGIFVDEDGVLAGVELKSTYGYGMMDAKKGNPKKEHLAQAMIYLYTTKLERFYLVYFDRGDNYHCEFEILYDEISKLFYVNGRPQGMDIDDIIDEYKKTEEVVKSNEIPNRLDICVRGGEPVVKFAKNKVDYKSDWRCINNSGKCKYFSKCMAEYLKGKKEGKWYGENKL